VLGAPADGPAERAGAASTDRVDEWSHALAAWARRELESGAADLHARARAELDRVLLAVALEATGGHRQQAAERLGLGRNTLTRKLGPSRLRRSPAR
jgi:two-component system nitrogen regulation response regulator GlnG